MAAQTHNGSSVSWVWWFVGGILILILGLLANCDRNTSTSSQSPTTGRPSDMPDRIWDHTTNRFQQGAGMSRSQSQEAARVIWEFEKARKARERR
jgi:hypothetical protein